VFYTVTTLTQDNEPLIGLVNFGDYRMYSTVESRVEESVELRRFETRAVSRPLPDPPLDERNTVTLRSDPFADLRPIDRQRLARMAEDAVQRMQRAFRERDAAALTALYADDYADALGKTRETVRTAFELFFSRFRPGPVHWQARDAQIDADGNVELTGYLRFTGFAYDHPGEAVADRAVEFPLGPSREVTLTFRPSGSAESAQGGLSIVRTDPPLPNLNDLFGRAAIVAAEPSL
jgi:ketosteroid isomerase-like protein